MESCVNQQEAATLGIFFRVVIKRLKLIKIKLESIIITKKKCPIHKVLKFSFTNFHILKLSNDGFTINVISYIFFNVHNQEIIKQLISHSITNILTK